MQKLSGLFLFAILISGIFSSNFAFAIEPIANDDFATTLEDTPKTISVLDNDSDADGDLLTIASVIQPFSGAVVISSSSTQINYTPNVDFNGIDSFTYVVSDGQGQSNTATVSIEVQPVNDPPVAVDDLAETQQNIPIRIDVLENDSDVEDDPLNILLVIDPDVTKGIVEVDNFEILFTPFEDFVGDTTFTYMASDGDKTSNLANVSVTVIEESNDPTIIDMILTQIQSLFDKILHLEDEITLLKDENSALATRITELESIIENGVPTNDDEDEDNDTEKVVVCHKGKNSLSISKNALPAHLKHGDIEGECIDISDVDFSDEIRNQIKELKSDFKIQEKELKNEFKLQEKELKQQLKDIKKDKKSKNKDKDDD